MDQYEIIKGVFDKIMALPSAEEQNEAAKDVLAVGSILRAGVAIGRHQHMLESAQGA